MINLIIHQWKELLVDVDYERSNSKYSDYWPKFSYTLITQFVFFTFPPQYENNVITIDLMQNSSQKTQDDVDIADVAYYFEKDVSINLIFKA